MARKFTCRLFILVVLVFLFSAYGLAQNQFSFNHVAQTGRPAPVPAQLSLITSFSFNDQGKAAFIADNGVLIKSGDDLTIVARPGQLAPGGGKFVAFSGPTLGANGQLVFRGEVSAPGVSGLFLFANGDISQLLPDGSVAQTGEGVIPTEPAVNDRGDVVFLNNEVGGIYLLQNGVVTRLANIGDGVPGRPSDTFLQFTTLAINHNDQVAFEAFLASTGSQGIFVASAGNIAKILGPGDTLPDGSSFQFVETNAAINDLGQLAFGLVSTSGVSSGMYLFSNGKLQLVSPDFFTISASINNAGQIAFTDFAGVQLFSQGVVTSLQQFGGATPDGGIFGFNNVGLVDARINNAGQVLFPLSELHEAEALFLFAGGQTSRFAGTGDPVHHHPKLNAPFAFGIANDGTVLISDSTFPGNSGLFTSGPASDRELSLVAHVGQSFGLSANMIDVILASAMNRVGQVAILTDTTATRNAVLFSSAGAISIIADNSSPVNPFDGGIAVNNPGDIFFPGFEPSLGEFGFFLSSHGQTTELISFNTQDVEQPSLNDNDAVAFLSRSGGGNVLFAFSQGNLVRIAGDGDPTPDGGFFNLFNFDDVNSAPRSGPILNDQGDVVFAAFDTANGSSIFRFRNGAVSRLVGAGDAAPDGSSFTFVDAPQINASGEVVFFGQTTTSSANIFAASNGAISEVVHAGSKIGERRLGNVDLPFVNDNGEIAFTADLLNGDTAIFVASPREEETGATAEPDSDYRADSFHKAVKAFRVRDQELLQQRKPKARNQIN